MAHTRLSYRQRAGSSFFEAPARGRPIGIGRPVPVASTGAVQQGFQNFIKKRRATPTPMGTRAPVRGACVSAIAIGSRGAEGTRKKLRAAALAFPTAAAPLISPKLCGPPTGLPIADRRQVGTQCLANALNIFLPTHFLSPTRTPCATMPCTFP